MPRIIAPGMRALRWKRDKVTRPVMEVTYAPGEQKETLAYGDVLIVPAHVAILMHRRDPSGFDLENIGEVFGDAPTLGTDDTSHLPDDALIAEMKRRGIGAYAPYDAAAAAEEKAKAEAEAKAAAEAEEKAEAEAIAAVTAENYQSVTKDVLVAALEARGVKINKKLDKGTLQQMILPYFG